MSLCDSSLSEGSDEVDVDSSNSNSDIFFFIYWIIYILFRINFDLKI